MMARYSIAMLIVLAAFNILFVVTLSTVYLYSGQDFFERLPWESFESDGWPISKNDVYISIKTSGKFHDTRVELVLKTWWNGLKDQVYFVTDTHDQGLINKTDGHVITTNCGKSHNWWWCHFDDDNYVNPSMLVDALQEYDWRKPHYIGRPSFEGDQIKYYKKEKAILRFATGGAGICITRNMSELMAPWMRNGTFVQTCKDLNQPDDVTLGFIATNRLGIGLTRRNDFNSHLQEMQKIPTENLFQQVILSYGLEKTYINVINLTEDMAPFSFEDDESRLLSYHCIMYPSTEWCP